jgi:hypothetical protein
MLICAKNEIFSSKRPSTSISISKSNISPLAYANDYAYACCCFGLTKFDMINFYYYLA